MKIKLRALLPILFVSGFSFGQSKVTDIKVDSSITGFHFAANFQGTLVYTIHGKSDLTTVNPTAFSISLLPNATYELALTQIDNYLSYSTRNGYTHSDILRKDTTVNGNKGFYTTLTETLKGTDYRNLVFHAFYIKDNTAVLFISGDLDNGKYIENFKKTFYSLKF
jgi:hypothetical protein